jgi:hypothetical protein
VTGIARDCRTDVLVATAPVLPYGQSATIGAVRCSSRTTGVTCVDGVNGDAFIESRDSTTIDVLPSR